MTPIATSLLHRFRTCFADLADLRDDEGRAKILEGIASHMRSIAPLVTPEARAEVTRVLADESEYRLSIVEGCLVIRWSDPLATMTDVEVIRFRSDVESVMRSRGVTP